MVKRLRLKELLDSSLPESLGICRSNWAAVADYVNRAQERLLTCKEAGDTGWYGCFAEAVFNVSRTSPYLTLPREVARLIKIDPCNYPVEVHNQWYEYLGFGSGRWPKVCSCGSGSTCSCNRLQAYRRNTVCTFFDIASTNKFLRIYTSEPGDNGLRAIIGCRDSNGIKVFTEDGPLRIDGVVATMTYPWVDVVLPNTVTPVVMSAITNVQKDITLGYVNFYEVDATTGAQRLLLTMEPGETVAAYEAYYLDSLPRGCCNAPGSTDDSLVQMTAMVKLDLIPARTDSDYLLIQSKEAIHAECQAIRFSNMDSVTGKAQAVERHREAVRYLQGELVHREGRETVDINFAPFGSARLENQMIGLLQ